MMLSCQAASRDLCSSRLTRALLFGRISAVLEEGCGDWVRTGGAGAPTRAQLAGCLLGGTRVQARQTNRRRDSSMHQKAVAVLVALAAVAVALVVALPADAAGNPGTTQVSTFDPTGAVFACPGTDYTVLGGIVRSVFHDSIAANGSEHVTGTISPIGLTLSDGTTSTIYRLSGASWFG